ncbi:glycosyltransferase [Nocardia sp. SYP-A9097]|uniref:glycosyltransferase n=1 Tax=Nocardia sp. SYP-A9097 TaxID=2663237 RepID=UPI00129A3F2F|nr:glycosyltransferase [Nocardia sp. SYP-A9097]MRH86141.1 glycosyltransferase [Nocardia sp. SYP-A9097]
MRVAVLTYGSRGDFQPHLAVADELRTRGHDVVVAANKNNLEAVRRAGITAVPIPVDIRAFLSSPAAQRFLFANGILDLPGKLEFARRIARLEAIRGGEVDDALIQACEGADLVVTGPMIFARAQTITERSGQPLVGCLPFPIERSREFSSPHIYDRPLPTPLLRRASHTVFEQAFLQANRAGLRRLRRKLKMPEQVPNPFARLRELGTPMELLVSPVLFPKPRDWPDRCTIGGTPILSERQRAAWGEVALDPGLEAWLAADEAPIFFSLGSIPVEDPVAHLAMITEVTTRLGARALVAAGYTNFPLGPSADGRVMVCGPLDYDKVLPRCRAAVHAGGPGTTHDVARAGIPSVVTPVFGDQILWGWRVSAAGIGVDITYRKLTEQRLLDALARVTESDVRARATAAGAAIAGERGAQHMCDTIERHAAG